MPQSAIALPPNKQPQERRTMSIKTQDVAGDGLFGYLAQPEAAGKGAVLIVPTIFGVNAFARGFAETLAHAGLTAAVCDLYSGQPLPANYEAALAQGRKLNDQIIDDIETRWLDHLQRSGASLGIIGFCLGGRCAPIKARMRSSSRPTLPARCISASPASITWRRPRPIVRLKVRCSAALRR